MTVALVTHCLRCEHRRCSKCVVFNHTVNTTNDLLPKDWKKVTGDGSGTDDGEAAGYGDAAGYDDGAGYGDAAGYGQPRWN